jgi:hypothetical protein
LIAEFVARKITIRSSGETLFPQLQRGFPATLLPKTQLLPSILDGEGNFALLGRFAALKPSR